MSRSVTIGLLMLGVAFEQTVAVSAENASKELAARIEAIPVQTVTITDEQFLKGDTYGRPTTIAGVLRIAQGSGRLPAVILVHGSGGFNANVDLWDQQFGPLGISTFAMDSFTGRGIVSTVVDQSQLGRLNMILDLYRSLSALASHPQSRSQSDCSHRLFTRRSSDAVRKSETVPEAMESQWHRSRRIHCVLFAVHHDLHR